MLRFALAFLVANVWVQLLPELTVNNILMSAGVALLLYLWRQARRWLTVPAIVAFLIGLVWTAMVARAQLRQDLAPSLEGQDLIITGHIADIPEVESYGVRFAFNVDAAQPRLPQRIELTWYQPPVMVHAAERWQMQVRLKRRHGFANPGGYDYEAQLFRDGVGATGYIRTSASNQRLGLQAGERVLKLRAALTEAIAHAIPDAPMQGVVRGLAVGDQQAISSEAWRVFSRTGTSHLMAISGFHIGMVAWLFAWLGSRLIYLPAAQRWRWSAPDLRAIFGVSAAIAYSLLAGMSVPTQRTLIMLMVYFGTTLLRREVNVWHSFGLALLLVLLMDPFATLAIGAWLSFGAVAVILLNQVGRVGRSSAWREFLNIQAVVSLGLVPLLLAAFGGLSLVSPWVNLLAIPLFTAVLVPLVLVGCALLPLHQGLATWWLNALAKGLDMVFAGLQWAANLSWASWYAPQAADWALLLLVAGTVMMVLPWVWPLRVSGLLWCLPALSWHTPTPTLNGFEITTLDVGQGLAVVVRTHRHVLLYDAGPRFQSGRDTGEMVVLPYLRAMGVRRLDMVMASHGDDDHVGGLQSVLTGMQTTAVLLGPSVPQRASASLCQRGQQWQWDGVMFEVLHPGPELAGKGDNKGANKSDNNQSCVLHISAPGGSALLLGDIEQVIEHALVDTMLIQRSDLVVAAHHGSRSSSTAALINAAHARWVVFSAGYRNRWGFPKQEVVARWQAAGAEPVSTIDSGAVSAWLEAGQPVQVHCYRLLRPRYWQAR